MFTAHCPFLALIAIGAIDHITRQLTAGSGNIIHTGFTNRGYYLCILQNLGKLFNSRWR